MNPNISFGILHIKVCLLENRTEIHPELKLNRKRKSLGMIIRKRPESQTNKGELSGLYPTYSHVSMLKT